LRSLSLRERRQREKRFCHDASLLVRREPTTPSLLSISDQQDNCQEISSLISKFTLLPALFPMVQSVSCTLHKSKKRGGSSLMYILPNGKPIDLDMLELAMQDSDLSSSDYLSLQTGEIISLSDLEERKREEIEWSNQHVLIQRISSDEAYQWRQDFIAQVVAPHNKPVAERLSLALNGKGPFRRFKKTLHQMGDDWVQAWYQWRDDQLHEHMQRWLADLPTTVAEV
jgi:hypothetical protein